MCLCLFCISSGFVYTVEICRLSLTDLIMSDNLVVQLPTAICKMKLLVELEVDGNPLTLPPPQVIFLYLCK